MLYKCIGKWHDVKVQRHWYLRRKRKKRTGRQKRNKPSIWQLQRGISYNLMPAWFHRLSNFSKWIISFREIFETRRYYTVLGKGSEIREALRVYPQKLDNHLERPTDLYDGDYRDPPQFRKWIKLSLTYINMQFLFIRSLIVCELRIKMLFLRGWTFAEGRILIIDTDPFIARRDNQDVSNREWWW